MSSLEQQFEGHTDTLNLKHSPQQQSAIQMLIEFQNEILDLFKHYQHTKSAKSKQNFKARIYLNLVIYAQIENDIFYPALKNALIKNGLLPELQMTFDPLIELIYQLDFQNPNVQMHEQNILDLEKYFTYYVKVQQDEMFVKAEKLGMNLLSLGQKIRMHRMKILNC